MTRPLPIAGVFALAIAVGRALAIPAAAGFAVAVAAVVAALLVRRAATTIVAVAALGAVRGAPAPDRFTGVDDRVVDTMHGRVGAPVVRTELGWGAPLATTAGIAWLYADRPLRPGQVVTVTGLVRTARGSRGLGQVDRQAALAARGARVEIVAQELAVDEDAPTLAERAWRWADRVRADGAAAIDAAGGDPVGRAALRGIALGDRADVPASLDANWRNVGIFHVLSVSGLHLAVVAGLAFALLRRLVALLSARAAPARWAAPVALALALAYTLVTGAQLATLRALVVVALVMIGEALERPLRLVDALGIAALAILAWRPADLWDPSFQLSFVAALVLALRPRQARATGGRTRRLASWLARGIATSTWISLATAPITAYHFQQVQLGGAIGNVVLTPAIELVALPLTLGGLVLGLATPIRLAAALVALVDRGAAALAQVTPVGAIAVASPIAMVVLVAGAIALAAWPPGRRGRLALVVVTCIVWCGARAAPPTGALRVTFLDVGQGDAALVELPGGEVWLVDAGGDPGARDATARSATGLAVERALRAYGHDRIDLVAISHPHPDHYLGLAALAADDVELGEVWSARELEPPVIVGAAGAASFDAVLAAARHIPVHPPLGVARSVGGVELVVLGPRYADGEGTREAADPVRSVNDNSLVFAIRYAGRTILFTGDVEAEGEADLIAALGGEPVDVVKVAHHGSPTSSTVGFVAATHPRVVVISCGRANRFGFPSPAVVARWEAVGAEVRRTDRDGAVVVTVAADGQIGVE